MTKAFGNYNSQPNHSVKRLQKAMNRRVREDKASAEAIEKSMNERA